MNEIRPRLNWRQRAGTPAAILMFLIGFGLLIWAAIQYFIVIFFGGSTSEVWSLLALSVLPFLIGWDFLPGTKRNVESPPVRGEGEVQRPPELAMRRPDDSVLAQKKPAPKNGTGFHQCGG